MASEKPPLFSPESEAILSAEAIKPLRNESVIFNILRREPRKVPTRRQRIAALGRGVLGQAALIHAALTWDTWDVSKALGSRDEF